MWGRLSLLAMCLAYNEVKRVTECDYHYAESPRLAGI